MSLIFIDYYFEFSYNIHLSHKIEKVSEINKILSSTNTLSQEQISELEILRDDILNKQYFWHSIRDLFSWNISFDNSNQNMDLKEFNFKHSWKYLLASTYYFLIIFLTVCFLLFLLLLSRTDPPKKNNLFKTLIAVAITSAVFLVVSYYIGQWMPYFENYHGLTYIMILITQFLTGLAIMTILGRVFNLKVE